MQLEKDNVPEVTIKEFIESLKHASKMVIPWMRINCWYASDYESAAMWKLYAPTSGLAIRTTFPALRDSFIDTESVFIGKVNYINYETDVMDLQGNVMSAVLYKRHHFQHENEVRAVCMNAADQPSASQYIKVDLDILIKEIVIAPYAPNWFKELVREVGARLQLKAPIVDSQLTAEPAW